MIFGRILRRKSEGFSCENQRDSAVKIGMFLCRKKLWFRRRKCIFFESVVVFPCTLLRNRNGCVTLHLSIIRRKMYHNYFCIKKTSAAQHTDAGRPEREEDRNPAQGIGSRGGHRTIPGKKAVPICDFEGACNGRIGTGLAVRKRLIDAGGFLRSFARTPTNSDEGVHPAFSLMLEKI